MKKLLQVQVDENLWAKLSRIAHSKGINLSSYVKMTLVEKSRKDDKYLLTDNGFTNEEEERILNSYNDFKNKKEMQEGKEYQDIESFLDELENEV